MDKDARSGYVDPEDALAALPDACFDPVCQLDWERSIVWEHSAGSVSSALAQMTQLNLAEEEEVESEAEVLSAGETFSIHLQPRVSAPPKDASALYYGNTEQYSGQFDPRPVLAPFMPFRCLHKLQQQ